jgi:hypothetical protein
MNYPQQSAQGLASLGRGNDSMLMHVTPREVAGLQSLAMAQGGSLTINPHTGLPEAGFFDSIFSIAAPVIGGYFGLDPFLMAGIMGGKSLIEEGDPFKAVMAGFGGYSGAKMGVDLKDFTTPLTVPTAVQNTFEGAAENVANLDPSKLMQAEGGIKPTTFADTTPYNRLEAPNFNVENAGFNAPATGIEGKLDIGIPSNLKDTTVPPSMGIKDTGYNTFSSTPAVQVPDAIKPITPTAPIETFGQSLGKAAQNPVEFARKVGDGSALTGAAKIGMYGASPFMEDILSPEEYAGYEDPEKGKWTGPQGQLNLSNKYSTGLKLLPNLNQPIRAAQGGTINAYAAGGIINNPSVGAGIPDLYNRPEGQAAENISNDGYGIGRLNTLASQESLQNAKTLGYAEGGETHLNLDELPSLNIKTGVSSLSAPTIPDGQHSDLYNRFYAVYGDKLNTPTQSSGPNSANITSFGDFLNRAIPLGGMARGGNGSFAQGGYLDGQGDGMSDSIPATIEGKQPARLADGEFVVPADVVSHIGNGSSKAGSKRLYAMLDKIRKARTGHAKQGKQINPNKYMPA